MMTAIMLQWNCKATEENSNPGKDLEKEIPWSLGFRYSWRKMETTAQDNLDETSGLC